MQYYNDLSMSCIAFFLPFTVALTILNLQDSSFASENSNNMVYAQQGPILSQQQEQQTEPLQQEHLQEQRQILPQQQQAQQQQQQPLQQGSTPLGVKILSPVRGESIPVGKDLTIKGQSTDNSVSECNVSVIVNSVRPYQQANPTGRGGNNDYSSWEFNLSQDYVTIREGTNEITAKLSCLPPSSIDGLTSKNISKWYSINVTGIVSSTDSVSSSLNDSKLPLTQQQPPSLQTNTLEEPVDHSQNNSINPDIDISEPSAEAEAEANIPDLRENTPDRNGQNTNGNGNNIVQGNNNDNQINGGNGNEIIYGNGGDDILSGDNGNDIIYGEEGDDKLSGDNGDDILSSGSGDDILAGQNGSDSFDCGEGDDMVIDYEDTDIVNQNCENY
jgi:Ca2+-binding RTX toxin-like protein